MKKSTASWMPCKPILTANAKIAQRSSMRVVGTEALGQRRNNISEKTRPVTTTRWRYRRKRMSNLYRGVGHIRQKRRRNKDWNQLMTAGATEWMNGSRGGKISRLPTSRRKRLSIYLRNRLNIQPIDA